MERMGKAWKAWVKHGKGMGKAWKAWEKHGKHGIDANEFASLWFPGFPGLY